MENNKSNKDFEKAREILNTGFKNGYNEPYILRSLREKESLRCVFLAIVKLSPALVSEIMQESLLSKNTCYAQLFKLLKFNLIRRIYVTKIVSGEIKNDAVKERWENWSKFMPDGTKNYFQSKTSFFEITDYGKRFALDSINFENEFKVEVNGNGRDFD